jgi:hypothetical protein
VAVGISRRQMVHGHDGLPCVVIITAADRPVVFENTNEAATEVGVR